MKHITNIPFWLQRNITLIMEEQELGAHDALPIEFLDPIKALWVDAGVKKAIAKGNEFALHDNLD